MDATRGVGRQLLLGLRGPTPKSAASRTVERAAPDCQVGSCAEDSPSGLWRSRLESELGETPLRGSNPLSSANVVSRDMCLT